MRTAHKSLEERGWAPGSISPVRGSGKSGKEKSKRVFSSLHWLHLVPKVPTSPGHTTTISVFGRQMMDDLKYEASLVCIARLCLTYQSRMAERQRLPRSKAETPDSLWYIRSYRQPRENRPAGVMATSQEARRARRGSYSTEVEEAYHSRSSKCSRERALKGRLRAHRR